MSALVWLTPKVHFPRMLSLRGLSFKVNQTFISAVMGNRLVSSKVKRHLHVLKRLLQTLLSQSVINTHSTFGRHVNAQLFCACSASYHLHTHANSEWSEPLVI